jgi:hypothetical protein
VRNGGRIAFCDWQLPRLLRSDECESLLMVLVNVRQPYDRATPVHEPRQRALPPPLPGTEARPHHEGQDIFGHPDLSQECPEALSTQKPCASAPVRERAPVRARAALACGVVGVHAVECFCEARVSLRCRCAAAVVESCVSGRCRATRC